MEQRFLADVMLGRLARWLRVLGYDTLYSRKGIDSPVVVQAFREERLILTRNVKLWNRLGSQRALFIHHDHFREQVSEVIEVLDLPCDPALFFSRCLECNLPLVLLPRESVQAKVPPYVFETQEAFRTCLHCSRIFWPGSHIGEMERLIETLCQRKGKRG